MEVIHLLDANVLINANRDYYPVGAVPEYWVWIMHLAEQGVCKMPNETFAELKGGNTEKDALLAWANDPNVTAALKMPEQPRVELVRTVLARYAPDLSDVELEEIGNDPFLIAHALADPDRRVVVTAEVSKPSKRRAQRRVPDVCRDLGITCIDAFEMNRRLGFSTSWVRRALSSGL